MQQLASPGTEAPEQKERCATVQSLSAPLMGAAVNGAASTFHSNCISNFKTHIEPL